MLILIEGIVVCFILLIVCTLVLKDGPEMCAVFHEDDVKKLGGIGFVQFVKRRSLFKVDYDIIFLGVYYIIVIFGYLIFEMIPINYRPILIEGFMEASYPSSTTLLVLSVMPTLVEQVNRRLEKAVIKKDYKYSYYFLFYIYKAIILLCYKGKN